MKVYLPHTYGREDVIRPELIQDIIHKRHQVTQVALTSHHPAHRELIKMENQATIAELRAVNKETR